MGGLDPPYEPLPGLYRRILLVAFGGKPRSAAQRSTEHSWGVFPGVVPPQDGPPNLGTARDSLGSIFLVALLPIFTDSSDFLVQIILVISRSSIHS